MAMVLSGKQPIFYLSAKYSVTALLGLQLDMKTTDFQSDYRSEGERQNLKAMSTVTCSDL